jgi:hypothetical protein
VTSTSSNSCDQRGPRAALTESPAAGRAPPRRDRCRDSRRTHVATHHTAEKGIRGPRWTERPIRFSRPVCSPQATSFERPLGRPGANRTSRTYTPVSSVSPAFALPRVSVAAGGAWPPMSVSGRPRGRLDVAVAAPLHSDRRPARRQGHECNRGEPVGRRWRWARSRRRRRQSRAPRRPSTETGSSGSPPPS